MKTIPAILIATLFSLFSVGCATTSMDALERPVFQIDCADVKKISSKSGDENFVIKFLNSRNSPLDMYWINYEGVEELKTSISPGETWSQKTYITHPWVAREKSGLCIAAFHSASNVLIEIE